MELYKILILLQFPEDSLLQILPEVFILRGGKK